MTRTNRDFYPTPPCAAIAIGEWLFQNFPVEMTRDPVVDPAAGFGTLLDWSSVPFVNRRALEIGDEEFVVRELSARVPQKHVRFGVDSLSVDVEEWPKGHVLANPPFNLLEEFVARACDLVVDGICTCERQIAAILTPVGFWHSKARVEMMAPDYLLALTWRPDFLRADTGTFQDFVWCVWDTHVGPDQRTQWSRLSRPSVPQAVLDEHDRLARMAAGREAASQLSLAMGAA